MSFNFWCFIKKLRQTMRFSHEAQASSLMHNETDNDHNDKDTFIYHLLMCSINRPSEHHNSVISRGHLACL